MSGLLPKLEFRIRRLLSTTAISTCILCVGSLAVVDRVCAQIELQCMYPVGIGRGASVDVEGVGKFPIWPVQVHCPNPDVVVTPLEEKGKFRVSCDANAACSLIWIRMSDEKSMSSLTPLVVEPRLVSEVDPNDRIKEAQFTQLPATVSGKLEKNEDVDIFGVELQAGRTLYARLIANQWLGSPMDAVMQILDKEGNVLVQNDDSFGVDPSLSFVAQYDAQYFIRVFAFPETPNSTIGFAGGNNFVYLLRLSNEPMQDYALPLEPAVHDTVPLAVDSCGQIARSNCSKLYETDGVQGLSYFDGDLPAIWLPLRPEKSLPCASYVRMSDESQVESVSPPCSLSGRLMLPRETHSWPIHLLQSGKFRARVISRELGFKLDSFLRVMDPESKNVLATNDDANRNQYDSQIEWESQADQCVELQISDLAQSFGPHHAYTIQVAIIQPTFDLSVTKDCVSGAAGTELDFPVDIDRRDGFKDQLEIYVEGLPESVTCNPIQSTMSESTKQAKLRIKIGTDAPAGHYPFRVYGCYESSGQDQRAIGKYRLRSAVSVDQFWLTVTR